MFRFFIPWKNVFSFCCLEYLVFLTSFLTQPRSLKYTISGGRLVDRTTVIRKKWTSTLISSGIHLAEAKEFMWLWQVILLGRSKYEGVRAATRPYWILENIARRESWHTFSRSGQPRPPSIAKTLSYGEYLIKTYHAAFLYHFYLITLLYIMTPHGWAYTTLGRSIVL